MNEHEKYDAFIKQLESIYPRAMRNVYCGVSIDEGWYHIVESLVRNIHSHVKWKRGQRARDLMMNRAIKKGRDAVLARLSAGKQPTDWEVERADEIMTKGQYEPYAVCHHVEIHQIKEKFGGLRFYFQGGDADVHGMVRMAEAWADHTCEVCGERGTIRHGGWVKNLCEKHHIEREEKRKSYE